VAIKFPKKRPEKNEVIHPDDLVENIGEFINEINGNLDSDNFKDPIHQDHFVNNAFTEIHTFRQDAPFFNCSHTTTSYIKTDSQNRKLAGVEINASTDGWAIIDFNVTFKWDGNGLISEEMAKDVHTSHCFNSDGDSPSPHGYINGHGFARIDMPAGGWMGICGSDGLLNPGDYPSFTSNIKDAYGRRMGGLSAGNFPMGQWSDLPTDMYVAQFRITINGNVVSESGYLFNGNWRNSLYLCGVTPVVAGRNAIDVEVRTFSALKLKTSRAGVGARDDNDRRGEKFSFQIESSEFHPTPLPEVKKKSLDIDASTDFYSQKDGAKMDSGISCTVTSRNLLVQFRKR